MVTRWRHAPLSVQHFVLTHTTISHQNFDVCVNIMVISAAKFYNKNQTAFYASLWNKLLKIHHDCLVLNVINMNILHPNSLVHEDAITWTNIDNIAWHQLVSWNFVNIGSGDGLLCCHKAIVCSTPLLTMRIGLYTASVVSLKDALICWRASDCDAPIQLLLIQIRMCCQ